MYLTIAYTIISIATLFAAYHTKKLSRLMNIAVFILSGLFALQRVISGNHSIAYPDASEIFNGMLMVYGQMNFYQWVLVIVLTLFCTVTGWYAMTKYRDRG